MDEMKYRMGFLLLVLHYRPGAMLRHTRAMLVRSYVAVAVVETMEMRVIFSISASYSIYPWNCPICCGADHFRVFCMIHAFFLLKCVNNPPRFGE